MLPYTWSIGDQAVGIERRPDERLEIRYGSGEVSGGSSGEDGAARFTLVYGCVNDPAIVSLELKTPSGEILRGTGGGSAVSPSSGTQVEPAVRLREQDLLGAGQILRHNGNRFFLFYGRNETLSYGYLRGLDESGNVVCESSIRDGGQTGDRQRSYHRCARSRG